MENLSEKIVNNKKFLLEMSDYIILNRQIFMQDLTQEAIDILTEFGEKQKKDGFALPFSSKGAVTSAIQNGKYNYDLIDKYKDELDWEIITMSYEEENLPNEFIERYYNEMGINNILKTPVSEDFIIKHLDDIESKNLWFEVSCQDNISESFMNKYDDKLDIRRLSFREDISSEFVKKHIDKIDFSILCSHWKLWGDNIDIIDSNLAKMDWGFLSLNKYLTKEIINKYKNYFKWDKNSIYKDKKDFNIFSDVVDCFYVNRLLDIELTPDISRKIMNNYRNVRNEIIKNKINFNLVHECFNNIAMAHCEDREYMCKETSELIDEMDNRIFNNKQKQVLKKYYQKTILFDDGYGGYFYSLNLNDDLLNEFSDVINYKYITKFNGSNEFFFKNIDKFNLKKLDLATLKRLKFETILECLKREDISTVIYKLNEFKYSKDKISKIMDLYISLKRNTQYILSYIMGCCRYSGLNEDMSDLKEKYKDYLKR